MTIMRFACVVIFLCPVMAGASSVGGGSCQALYSEWDDMDKLIAYAQARGKGDNSAPRETSRQTEISVHTANKAMLMQMMVQKKCDIPATIMGSNEYQISALRCVVAVSGGASAEINNKCKMQRWEKDDALVKAEGISKKEQELYRFMPEILPDSSCQVPPCYAPVNVKK